MSIENLPYAILLAILFLIIYILRVLIIMEKKLETLLGNKGLK